MRFENKDGKVQSQKSLTSSAATHMKKAFGLQSSGSSEMPRSPSFRSKKGPTVAEIIRVQMRISEHHDMRTRRALSRAAAGQVGCNSTIIFASPFLGWRI